MRSDPPPLPDTLPSLLRLVLSLYVRHPRVLLIAAALPLVPGWLLRAYTSITDLDGGRVVNGAVFPAPDTEESSLLDGATTLLGVLGGAFSIGLTALIGVGLVLGRRIPFRAALGLLFSRPLGLVGWCVLTSLAVAATVAVAVVGVAALLSIGASSALGFLWIPAMPLLVLLVFATTAVAVAWPVALLEDRPLNDAIAAVWRMGRWRRGTYLLCVLLSGALVVAPAFAGRLASEPVEATGATLAVGFAVEGLLGFAVAPVAALLVCAPVLLVQGTLGQDQQPRDLDLGRVLDRLPGEAGRPVRRPVATVGLVAVLFSLPLTGAGMLWPNSYAVPGTTVLSLPDMAGNLSRMSVEHDGDTVQIELVQPAHPQTLVCDPECTTSDGYDVRASSLDLTDAQAAVTGGYAATWWRWWSEDADAHSGLELRVCHGTCADRADTTVIDTISLDRMGLVSTVEPLGEGLLIAAIDTPVPESSMVPPEEPMGLLAYHCTDLDCADPARVRLPDLPMADENASPYQYRLHLGVGESGSYSVLFQDLESMTTSLVTCPDLECAVPVARELPGLSSARIAMRPDGTPVIAHLTEEDAIYLLDCRDPGCAKWEMREIGPGYQDALGLAVDSLGRPQVAFSGTDGNTLTYVACSDTACSEWDMAVPFHHEDIEQPYRSDDVRITRVLLDADDRPTLVFGHDVVRCVEPRCGLEV